MVLAERSGPEEKLGDIFERHPELKEIPDHKFPKNVFIIPDGNGRWAKLRGLDVSAGHQKGAKVISDAFRDFNDLRKQIPFVGVWGLSIDNLNRPKEEVGFLMTLFNSAIQDFEQEILTRENRFIHIGKKEIFPSHPLWKTIDRVERETKDSRGQTVYVAIGFSGKDQTLRMCQKSAEEGRNWPGLEITEDIVESLKDGGGIIPPADLIIRSAERRLSDVGWIAGKETELHFDKTLFPDFTTQNFVNGIIYFSERDRTFGSRPATQS